jgi:hypothetical protein
VKPTVGLRTRYNITLTKAVIFNGYSFARSDVKVSIIGIMAPGCLESKRRYIICDTAGLTIRQCAGRDFRKDDKALHDYRRGIRLVSRCPIAGIEYNI